MDIVFPWAQDDVKNKIHAHEKLRVSSQEQTNLGTNL